MQHPLRMRTIKTILKRQQTAKSTEGQQEINLFVK